MYMSYAQMDACELHEGIGGPDTPIIYVLDSPQHPFELGAIASHRHASIVTIPIEQWNDSLTPWPAKGLYKGDADFGGMGRATLDELQAELIPRFEAAHGLAPNRRAVCGYSLGGLFALYALTHSVFFDACGCLSGSVWYEGWVDHLRACKLSLKGRFAFLSVGSKERRAALAPLRGVQDNMQACAHILEQAGCEVQHTVVPGGHMHQVAERLATGLLALDAFLRRHES